MSKAITAPFGAFQQVTDVDNQKRCTYFLGLGKQRRIIRTFDRRKESETIDFFA
jgi:hypothetical protein